jgi:hypothetical protein
MLRPPIQPRRSVGPLHCRYCGRQHSRDLGCAFCRDTQRARFEIERKRPGAGLQHENLTKLAGHLAAGLAEGFRTAHGRGQFDPTYQELQQAAAWALDQFLSSGYVLRSEPNGSMTSLQSANERKPQPTNEPGEERQQPK